MQMIKVQARNFFIILTKIRDYMNLSNQNRKKLLFLIFSLAMFFEILHKTIHRTSQR